MAQIETWLVQEMLDTVKIRYLDGNIFSQDNAGNLIGVKLFQDGVPYSGGGSVAANVIRADGATVAVPGALSGNIATIILPQAAYAVVGAVSIIIKLTVNGEITTISAVIANVYRSSTDSIVDPGTIIPSIEALIAEIESVRASIPEGYDSIWSSLAPVYSSNETYTYGQLVEYDGDLYRCITNIESGETWTAAHWESASLGQELSKVKKAIRPNGIEYRTLIPAYEIGKIDQNGNVVADSSLRYIPYANIADYTIVKISVSTSDGYAAFYDYNKTFISSVNLADYTVGSNAVLSIPNNAVFFRFTASVYASLYAKNFYVSYNNLQYNIQELYRLDIEQDDLINRITTSNGYKSYVPTYVNGRIDSDGSVVSDSTVYYSDYVDITNYAYAAFTVSTDKGYLAFYDSNKTYIEDSSVALNTKTIGNYELFKKPDGACYYRVTVSTYHATSNLPLYGRFSYATLEDFPPVYHVEKDGKGDFTSLVDAIREAIKHKNATVFVGDGVWDIVDELGPEYISGVYVGQRGLYLQNGIHVICSSKSIIKCEYTGDLDEVKTWLAAFNSGPLGFTLENATIIGKNIRYVIHDERDYTDPELYINKYINCKMYLDNSGNTAWHEMQVIGGGLGLNGYIDIDGCYFESETVPSLTAPYVIVAWHNSQDLNNHGAKSRLEIKNSYFAEDDRTFRITGMGNSTEVSDVFISSCSFSAAPIKAGTNNVQMITWCNEIRE